MKQGDEGENCVESLFVNKGLYRILFENSVDAIFFTERSKIVDCNKKACSMLGFSSKEEIVGKFLFDFSPEIQPDGIPSKQKYQELVILSIPETTAKFSWKYLKSDKTSFDTEVILNSFHHENRIFQQFTICNISYLNLNRDNTDRKQAEESLRQSEIKYRNLIETMPDGVYRSTPEGKFIEVNSAMVKMLGYESKEELLAIDIKTDLYFDLSDRENILLNQNQQDLDVYPLKKKDGTAVWVEDHGWYVTNENGQILFHEGISRDITDRKMAEMQLQKYSEELQKMNATKDKFFSIIAHDLKSPFNSIMGLSEIIKTEAKDLDIKTIEQYAGIIYSTSKNTFRLLENLLDWARVQQSQILFRPVQVILKKIVSEVVEMLVEKANSKMIAVINYIPDNLIVMADQDMLKTILRNLISNALKFTPANGKVEIKTVSTGDTIEISVKDTGIGIKNEDISKLFKIDSSFSKSGTENEKGTGLGLLLCKEFVEKHGGKIRVESEEGKGSTFTFSINNNDSILKNTI